MHSMADTTAYCTVLMNFSMAFGFYGIRILWHSDSMEFAFYGIRILWDSHSMAFTNEAGEYDRLSTVFLWKESVKVQLKINGVTCP